GSPAGQDPFRSSLTPDDRQQLAILMSVFGLPALRRLVGDPTRPFDDPKGQVFRPDPPALRYLDPLNRDEGFFTPRGFDTAEIDLTSCRASVNLRWEGEPPAPTKETFAQALSVENYIHVTDLGWDSFVQVVWKGFLFPLGHRASLVKVTQRRFLPKRENADGMDPTAYLIQRFFIICRRPMKTFPALNQPFGGRHFPAQTVEMVTTVTEDLSPDFDFIPVDQEWDELKSGNHDRLPIKPAAVAFWPQRVDKTDVIFQYKLNGDSRQVSSPLLFVDNVAAHSATTMRAIVEAYNNYPNQLRRTASHGGAERKYADTARGGETSFPTNAWRLAAEGRLASPDLPIDPVAVYTFDALMEGADQPPFYPVCKEADVIMASVDRLLGRAQGAITVSFYDGYLKDT